MIDFNSWLQGDGSIVKTQIPLRATVQQSRILDKDTDVEFKRNGTDLAPQTVRIEFDSFVTDANSEAGTGYSRKGTLFGIRGHPLLDDTDVQVWDTFVMDKMEYTIIFVNLQTHGQVQAIFEAVR